MYDLPSENPEEPGLPDEFHFLQPLLLLLTFIPANWNSDQIFAAGNLNLYYDVNHPQWFKRPDWFDASGALILMPSEEAAAAEQRAEQLAARLRELGLDTKLRSKIADKVDGEMG